MAESEVLALDITEDAVSGILFTEDKRAVSLVTSHCCLLNKNISYEAALVDVVARCKGEYAQCRVSFGAEFFHYRLLNLPFTDVKKIQSILPFEVLDSASFSEDELIFDYLLNSSVKDETEVLAALIKKDQLRKWLRVLKEHGLDPEILTISGLPATFSLSSYRPGKSNNFANLSIGFSRATLYLVLDDEVRAIRSFSYDSERQAGFGIDAKKGAISISNQNHLKECLKRLAAEIQTTVFAFKSHSLDEHELDFCFGGVVGAIPDCAANLAQFLDVETSDCNWLSMQSINYLEEKIQPWPKGLFDDALALVFGVGKERKQFNFRKEEFSWTGGDASLTRTWRYGLITALLFFVAFVLYQVFDFHRLSKERDQLTAQIEDVYVATIKGAKPGRDPVSELKVKVNKLKETAAAGTAHDPEITAVKLLADVSERIPQSMQISFERFIYDQETIRIRGVTDNFNTVDQMKKTLEKSPYFSLVAIGSANVAPKENGVRFELKLQL